MWTLECTSGRELLTVVDGNNLTIVYGFGLKDTRGVVGYKRDRCAGSIRSAAVADRGFVLREAFALTAYAASYRSIPALGAINCELLAALLVENRNDSGMFDVLCRFSQRGTRVYLSN